MFRVLFHCIGCLMGGIYLDSTKYTDRTVIISPRVGIPTCVVINGIMSHSFSHTWLRDNVGITGVCSRVQAKPFPSHTARLGCGPDRPNGWTSQHWVLSQTRSIWIGGIIVSWCIPNVSWVQMLTDWATTWLQMIPSNDGELILTIYGDFV